MVGCAIRCWAKGLNCTVDQQQKSSSGNTFFTSRISLATGLGSRVTDFACRLYQPRPASVTMPEDIASLMYSRSVSSANSILAANRARLTAAREKYALCSLRAGREWVQRYDFFVVAACVIFTWASCRG